MSTTTLLTRIQNKFDTLATWNANTSKVLLRGEIAFVQVPANSTAVAGDNSRPQYIFKVGDGTSTFAQLPWVSAIAADVFDWAKSENKPTYSAAEIQGLKDYIDTNTENDTDTQYQLEQDSSDGHKIRINSKLKSDTTWTKGDWITIPDNNTVYTLSSFGITASAAEINYVKGVTSSIQTQLNDKATAAQGTKADNAMPKAGGTFTGSVTFNSSPVVPAPTADSHAVNKAYLDTAISQGFAANDAMVFKGVINSTTDLPSSYSAGDTYRVAKAGTYFGHVCEVGDLLICVSDYGTAANNADWSAVQNNVNKPGYFDGNVITTDTAIVADGTAGKLKSVSLATSSPAASGSSLSFIDTISQDASGKISATKKSVTVDANYSATSANPASGKAIAAALASLDFNQLDVSASETVKAISEVDGKISVTKQSIAIAQSQVTNLTADLDKKQPSFTDGSATIASVANNVVTIKAGVSQSGGRVANSTGADITLSKVAKTGLLDDLTQNAVLIIDCGTATEVF